MGMNPGSPGFAMPPAEDDFVREQKDIRRTIRENAAARTAEATSIGKGGILVKDGGSITVEAPGTIDLLGGAFAAATITASSTVQGATINSTGNMNASEIHAADAFISNAPLIGNNITTGRTSLWGRTSDGWVGNTSSSRRDKTNIAPAGIDPLAVLAIEVKHYSYIAEVRKRDDPTSPEYAGPDYHVAQEVGAIAEDMHEAGLWEFVVYEQEVITAPSPTGGPDRKIAVLKLDENGDPVPQSIHYELWALAVHAAVQYVHELVLEQEKRIGSLESRLEAAGIK